MILADTSVWVDFFADRPGSRASLLESAIRSARILMGDLILVEILQGLRPGPRFRTIAGILSGIPCQTLCGPGLAPLAAANYRALRTKGITVRGTIGVVIATWCVENGVALLHDDRDFDPMERHLGLVCVR